MNKNKTVQITQYEKMTKTPIPRLLLSLSIPTVITMLITSVYNMADTAFVGMLGTSASGAVGVVFGFMSILQAIGFFFGQGCGSILSRELGAKDNESASKSASTGFFLSLFCAIILGIICAIIMDPLINFLGSTPTIAPYAKIYLRFILVSTPFIVPSFTLNNILRFEGKAKLGAVAMLVGALLNIAGDPIFMFGLHLGIAGAGLSTALAQIISFIVLLSMFLRGKTQIKLSIRLFSKDVKKIFNICGTGLPSLLRQSLGGLGVVILNAVAKPYGDPAIAAMSIVTRVAFMEIAIGLGIGQGFQPISSFNYGASLYSRVREGYKVALRAISILIVVISVGVFIFAPQIVYALRNDMEVVAIGTRALRLQCVSIVALPFCMMTEMLLQTTGNKAAASFLSSARGGLLFIPTLVILANIRGLAGIQEAQPVAYLISIIPSFILNKRFFMNLPQDGEI